MLARYNLSLKELAQVMKQIYKKESAEFQSFQRLIEQHASTLIPTLDMETLSKSKAVNSDHKGKGNEMGGRTFDASVSDNLNFKVGKCGYMNFQRKRRYFPLISETNPHATFGGEVTDLDNNLVETGFMLKLKGQSKRQRDRRKAFFQSEIPHAGTWVKRASSGLGSPQRQPKLNTEETDR